MENFYDKNKSYYDSKRQQQIVERLFVLEKRNQSSQKILAWGLILLVLLVVYNLTFAVFGSLEGIFSKNPRLGNWSNRPEVYQKVEMLKGKMDTLVTGSMENKINRLENNLSSGVIRKSDLVTIQELKTDLQILKTYSEQNSISSLAMTGGKRGTRGLSASNMISYPDELLQEISNMKNLFYLSIASCGFLVVVVSGAWLYSSARLKQIRGTTIYRQTLLDKPNPDLY